MSMQFARALVIGGSRGIGGAVTKELLAAGASVAFTFSKNEDAAKKIVSNTTLNPNQTLADFKLDVRQIETIRQVIVKAVTALGALDFLVYCPGCGCRTN